MEALQNVKFCSKKSAQQNKWENFNICRVWSYVEDRRKYGHLKGPSPLLKLPLIGALPFIERRYLWVFLVVWCQLRHIWWGVGSNSRHLIVIFFMLPISVVLRRKNSSNFALFSSLLFYSPPKKNQATVTSCLLTPSAPWPPCTAGTATSSASTSWGTRCRRSSHAHTRSARRKTQSSI